jgi:hypothetical protein
MTNRTYWTIGIIAAVFLVAVTFLLFWNTLA